MEKYLVDKETHVVHGVRNIFAMVPCMYPRTGRGLARYIQSLHQYQQEQELKSGPKEVYREHMQSQRIWLLR